MSKEIYQFTLTEVSQKFFTSFDVGLTHQRRQELIKDYGPNKVTTKKPVTSWDLLLAQIKQPLVFILIFASALTFFMGEYLDAVVIGLVIIINTVIGFIQERKALDAIAALDNSLLSTVDVLISGQWTTINSQDIVPGDVVRLSAGDKVPADIYIGRSKELTSDESSLTGESIPSEKSSCLISDDRALADRSNMLFGGCYIVNGVVQGIVVATGSQTEIGKISLLVESADSIDTPLTRRIREFSHVLVYVIVILATFTFFVSWMGDGHLHSSFLAAIALMVSAIPEGLPAAMTIMLALGVSKMARRKAIIRKLPAVETLGSTTIICSDKTGTLTKNQMTVTRVISPQQSYEISGSGYDPTGSVIGNQFASDKNLEFIFQAGLLCNNAHLFQDEYQQWSVQGDPTEGCLLVSARKYFPHWSELIKKYPRLDELPFQSKKQYMATLHKCSYEEGTVAYIKGSFEAVARRCTHQLNGDPLVIDHWTQQVDHAAQEGLRVLCFAQKTFSSSQGQIEHKDLEGLTFLGLQCMYDPPRDYVKEAVGKCLSAGIKVKMITGDHPGTALSIAKQLGMTTESEVLSSVVTGSMISKIDDEELSKLVKTRHVYARVSPEQKLKIVRSLQNHGEIIAMTGDGVNDAPALKQANIGIAMGLSGTEVARQASDIILTDDHFASIEAAVEEGRSVFENLKKFIIWTLPTNLGEALVLIIAIFIGLPLPLSPVHILWINMTTAVFLGLTLAFEPMEFDLMKKPPRDPSEKIIQKPLLIRTLFVGCYITICSFLTFSYLLKNGASETYARTVVVNLVIFVELFYLFNCRSLIHSFFKIPLLSNPWIWVGVIVTVLCQLLFVYSVVFQTLFVTEALRLTHWALILGFALFLFLMIELEKALRR